MIVVLGSRYDPAARRMVERIPGAELCSAEDLTQPGWAWQLGALGPHRWVVGGIIVDDPAVTGVLIRRSAIFPEELTGTHPEDREYLAAETTAFLAFVLARTRALVVNPIKDGAIGEEAMRVEHWLPLAHELGLRPAPLFISSRAQVAPLPPSRTVEVVGRQVFGELGPSLKNAAVAFTQRLGLVHASLVLDTDDRLRALSSASPPSDEALPALTDLLANGPR